MHYRPGIEIVPGYRLQRMLGRGGFGEVWQAEGPGRVSAAVKIIDKVEDKAGRKEFRALKLIKDLRHPNLVSITGFWLKDAEGSLLDSDAYIDESGSSEVRPSELIVAMDLCEKSLLDRLAECRKGLSDDTPGGIPLDELLEYMEAAAKAIDYLNTRHQIQHRDIKPHNIMIVGGSAQVCDFGLASAISTARTSMGGAGSLAYMAPEVYSTKLPSNATDQYSLAITYCELRTGRLPLSDVESFAVLDDAKRKGILDLSLLDERERGVIQRAAATDPAARFPTCYDMVQELRRALSSGFSISAPARAEPIAGYQLERSLRDRDGEEIWDAIDPDGLHVLLVVRTLAEAPSTASWSTLAAVRDVSRSNPRLAEVYEFACLSATDKVLPARLFKLPNPPAPTKTIVAGRRLPNNLSERLSSGGVPIKRLLLLLGDLAEALDFLNAPQHDVGGTLVGFQHANVRPVNFLLDDDRAVLSNFASTQLLAGDEAEFAVGKQLPESAFTPPEFLAGKITRWSDQYMLAVSYLQLRTGKPSASLSGSTGSGKRPDVRSRLDMSELRPAEREILSRATNADPRKRFATCREFAAALGKAWDEIFAAEAPAPVSSPRKSSHDPAAATLDANAVESVSLSGLRDSAQTVMEPQGPAAHRGATLVPSAIETRPPMDTNPDAPIAPPTPRRLKDAAHAGSPRPKVGGQREPTADEATTPWWRTRNALGAALAAIALAVAVPVVMSLISGKGDDPVVNPGGGGRDDSGGDSPSVDPAIARTRGEIEKLIVERSFVAAHAKLVADRSKLGDVAGAISDTLELAWSTSAAEKAKQGKATNDAAMLGVAVTDAAALVERFPSSQEGRQALVAAGASLVELLKKTLAKPDCTPAELTYVVRHVEPLLAALAALKPSDPNLTASATLVKARAEHRAEPTKRLATLAIVRAENLADPRDKAVLEALRALGDEKMSGDAAKLESLESSYRSRLDPFERAELLARIKVLRSGQDELLKQEWAALLAELRKRVGQGGAALVAARTDLEGLSTRNVAMWAFLTTPSNAGAFREYQALRILATLKSDELDGEKYATALEDLNEHIRGEKVAIDAPALCAAALERALKLESVLSYRADEKDKAATAQRLVGLARDVSKFAAAEFSQHADAINKSLADVNQQRIALAVSRLRALRDAANFAALGFYAAGVKEIAADSPPAKVLRTACAVECDLQAEKSPAVADRDELRSGLNAAAAEDKLYVEYVSAIARKDTLSDQLAATAEAIHKSYTSGAAEANGWRDHDSRKKFVFERLAAAAKAQSSDKIGDIANPFYTPGSDAAKQSAKWMTLAMQTARSCTTAPSTQTLLNLRYLEALANYYAAPEDATVCKTVASWTDALLAPEKNFNPPLQILLVNARSHAVVGDASAAVAALARLYDACRAAMAAADGPDPKAIDAQVLAPAVARIETALKADGSKLGDDARRSAARLIAARGRYAHLYPAVQEKVREQLTAAGDKRTVARAAFDWFDAAVKLDPSHADYYYGRGYSCDLRNDMSYAQRAAQMEADAKLALADGRQPKDFPAAHGLRGLGLLYQSLSIGDYEKRRAVLRQADEAYKKAIAACDALRNKPAAATYPDMESDYPLFLNGRGNVLLQLANFDADPATQRKFLTEALRLALAMTEDRSDSEEPTKLTGVHPEWAYQLAGNTIEDFGWVLKQPEYYPLALVQFTKAEGAATRLADPAGANLSRYKRARANFKLGSDGYLSAMATLGSLPVPPGGEATRAAQLKLLRERAERALKDADREMVAFLADASAASSDTAVPEVAEANAYLARIRLTNVNNGLWSSDEFATSMQYYDKAIAAAEQQALSPLDRASFMLDQSDAAMSFALLAKSQPADMADRFKKAREIAESLAADEKADATMRAKAYLMVARIRTTQATRAGEYRNEILAAFDKALALAAQSAENVAAARAQRGEYLAGLAISVNPRTAAENSLLAAAAADFYAALPKGEAMSRPRLRWGRNLAIVVPTLMPPADATAKAAFDRTKAEYVVRVKEICAQLDPEFGTRFNRQERMDYAASAKDMIVQAKKLFAYEPMSAEAKKLDSTIQAIGAAETEARREFDKWWERRPTLSK